MNSAFMITGAGDTVYNGRPGKLVSAASYADMTTVRALVIVLALAAVATGCAPRGGVPRPRPFPGATLPPGQDEPEPPSDPAIGGRAKNAEPGDYPTGAESAVVRTALGLLGVPYRNGGTDPSGFDCSGLVQWVYARHGTALPREVRDQYRVGREVDLADVVPGDLIFFETVARGASHVGVVIGEGRFLHAPSSNGVVRIEPYNANYWIRRFVGARRVNHVAGGALPVTDN
jgi:hypothetical protein